MGAVTAAAIAAGGAIVGGAMQNRAAGRAADAQRDAANAGIAEQRAAREQNQQNIQPYLDFGQTHGLGGLARLLADPNSIQDSAAYRWNFGQQMQGLDRSAASRGNLFSGGHHADVMSHASGLASQEYGNQWNRLASLATMGQNAAVGAGSMNQTSANAISNLQAGIGQAQAGGAINSANAWGNTLASLAGVAGQYMGARQSAYQQPQGGFGAFTPSFNSGTSSNSLITGNYAGLNGWRG